MGRWQPDARARLQEAALVLYGERGYEETTVAEIAESMLEIGQQEPISVRLDGDRLVLVEGLHRLEACKALGETTILGVVVTPESTASIAASTLPAWMSSGRKILPQVR